MVLTVQSALGIGLKLLWTNVSSKSMTMHFLFVSECRTCGSKCFCGRCNGGGVVVPSIGVPLWLDFDTFRRQQQNIDRMKLRSCRFNMSISMKSSLSVEFAFNCSSSRETCVIIDVASIEISSAELDEMSIRIK